MRAPRVAVGAAESVQWSAWQAHRRGLGSGETRWVWGTSCVSLLALGSFAFFGRGSPGTPTAGLVFVLFVGSSVHVASTAWLYSLPDVRKHAIRHRGRYIVAPLALMCGAGAVAGVLEPRVMAQLLLVFFCWQFFHFTRQNLGIVALAASASRTARLQPVERRCLEFAGLCGIAGLVGRPGVLQLAITSSAPALVDIAGIMFVGVVAAGAALLVRRSRWSLPAGFALAYGVALLFSAPIFVFGSPYAAVGGMTVAHGLQYLLLVGWVARGEGRRTGRRRAIWVFLYTALAGGAVLAVASHLHDGSATERMVFGVYLGAVMSHFVIDAGIWRLRDPFPRSFVSSRLPLLVAPNEQHRPTMDRKPI